MKFSYLVSSTALSLFFSDGSELLLGKHDRNYNSIVNLLMKKINEEITKADEAFIKELAEPGNFMKKASNGQMRLLDGQPQLKTDSGWVAIDAEVHDRFTQFLDSNTPLEPFIKFYESLNNNPSWNSRGQLFNFINNREMPVLPTGEVIGYKGVREDFMDIYSGSVHNYIGAEISMERKNVDDNPDHGCSYGYHVGSHNYANSWRGSEGKLLLVAFFPEDAVSVPHDSTEKLRVCKYRVIADITKRPHALDEPAYTADGDSVKTVEKYEEQSELLDHSDTNLAGFKTLQAKTWLYKKLNQGKNPRISKFLGKFHLQEEDFDSLFESDDIYVHWNGRIYSN